MTTLKPLQIFRPGRHTAMSGDEITFSEADLVATAAAYDPSRHEAPIVVGHPAADQPAYGWIRALTFAEGSLEATPDQVDDAFAAMVQAGRFKKISASFYLPDAPCNPSPGVYYLRHVGFLGAQPPAVKGLRAPEFAAGDEGGSLAFAFGEGGDIAAGLWRALREWLIERFGPEDAERVAPADALTALEQAARDEWRDDALAETSAPYGESQPPEKTRVTPEEKAVLEAENAQLKERLAAAQAAMRHAAQTSFIEGLVDAGRLLPAEVGVVLATLDFFAAQEGAVEFGEGEARRPLLDGLKDFFAHLPPRLSFAEHATTHRAADGAASTAFAAPVGYRVDPEGLARHQRAVRYQAEHGVDYLTAARAVDK